MIPPQGLCRQVSPSFETLGVISCGFRLLTALLTCLRMRHFLLGITSTRCYSCVFPSVTSALELCPKRGGNLVVLVMSFFWFKIRDGCHKVSWKHTLNEVSIMKGMEVDDISITVATGAMFNEGLHVL